MVFLPKLPPKPTWITKTEPSSIDYSKENFFSYANLRWFEIRVDIIFRFSSEIVANRTPIPRGLRLVIGARNT